MQQPSSADAVKRVLTMAGVTGAALTLSAAAALPAFANAGRSDQSQAANQSGASRAQGSTQDQDAQGTKDDEGANNDQGGDSTDNPGKADQSQGKPGKADQSQGDQSQSQSGQSQSGQSQGGQSQGGQTDGHNPPGNNGTVKIHQAPRDPSPHDVPQVSCQFYVSFFGFDNNQTLNVSFTGQAPTGKDRPIRITGSGLSSKTSTTDAGGAGNDYDGDLGPYDGSNLDLGVLGAPAKQGYHIKLDVSTGEPGGHKYKVFWFAPCGSTSGTTGGTTENGSTTTALASTTGTTGGASVLGESITRRTAAANTASGSVPGGASVLGESVTRSTPGLSSLPFTGSESGVLAALGLTALGGGTALTVAGRRRRAATRV